MADNRPDASQRPPLMDFRKCRRVRVSGVTMRDSSCWVHDYVRCDDLVIDNIRVISTAFWNNDGIDFPSSIAGLAGHPVSNVVLENIEIIYASGGVPPRAQVRWDASDRLPEQAGQYPEFSLFGELPAWGFYVRHAEGIEFRNRRVTLKQPDYRPAMIFDDVRGLRLAKVNTGPISGEPVIVLKEVKDGAFASVKHPKGIPKQQRVRRLGSDSPLGLQD